jgi:tryptophanyl-tRNA synthetase
MVPVGQDQLPHLELTREIARRFNFLYKEVFPIPKESMTNVPILPGVDGRKMSKSYGNTISFSDPPDAIKKKISEMITDPARVKKTDKGHPEVCAAFAYHKIFNKSAVDDVAKKCRAADIGCVECKRNLAEIVVKYVAPIRARRVELEKKPGTINDILKAGAQKASKTASATLAEAKRAMGIL